MWLILDVNYSVTSLNNTLFLYFSAEPGMGKTCSLALLAVKWATGTGNYCLIYCRFVIKYRHDKKCEKMFLVLASNSIYFLHLRLFPTVGFL